MADGALPAKVKELMALAIAVVSINPALAVPLRHYVFTSVIALDLMLLDFDAECEDMSDAIDRQLADWRAELDWSTYELVAVAS